MLKFRGKVKDLGEFLTVLVNLYGRNTTLKEVIVTLEAMRK